MSAVTRQGEVAPCRSPRPALAWAETFGLTAALLLLGHWLRPQDPYFVQADFSWILLGPLLAGLRYGFAHAVNSTLFILGAMLLEAEYGRALPPGVAGFALGLFAVALVAGEFRDQWYRRLDRLQAATDYCRERMDELSRAYQVLKLSHDGLEKRVAASTTNLRDCILSIRRQLLQTPTSDRALLGLAPLILRQFAAYGALQVASLHRVGDDRRVEVEPLATFGQGAYIEPDDPLLREALERGQAASLKADYARDQASLIGRLLLVVPIVDFQGRIWAVVAVQQMPFRAFSRENLRLLAVLGGHVGDLLTRRLEGVTIALSEAQDFVYELERCLADTRLHGLEASLVALRLADAALAPDLQSLIMGSHRGLDRPLVLDHRSGQPLILVLMPLTDDGGVMGYLHRLERMVKEQFGRDGLEAAGIQVRHWRLAPTDRRPALLRRLFDEVEVAVPPDLEALL